MEQKTADGLITSGEDISFWIDSVKPLMYEPLNKDIETDILIIGGGLAGITTAYCLLKAGKKVVLVEDGFIGSGESGRTTAHITCALDDRYYEIEKVFGEDGSKKAAESHIAAIEWIDKIVKEEQIDCDFERIDGYLFVHPTDTKESLVKEYEATRRAGLTTEWVEQIPLISNVTSPGIRFPNQAQFHLMKYLQALAQAVVRMGGIIYTSTRAKDIDKKGAICNGYKVNASHIVVATNTPVNDFITMHTKQFPYRTYVIGAKVPKGKLAHTLWWDTGDMKSIWVTAPYHYVRLNKYDDEYDLLISGGEDHKTGQADEEKISEEDRHVRLTEWTRNHFPMIEDIVYKWSGQVIEPVDYMAFIGKNPGDDNVYIITSDSGNGMTHCTIGGIMITDMISGKDNPWTDLYSPKRIPLKTPGTFISEVFNTFKQYGDYIKKSDIKELDQLKTGEGAILGKGLKKLAVYRDEHNNIHSFSAVCPHMGCVVQWNASEKSFDCPCHGSRFTKEGTVINGPASSDLKKLEIKD
jgi:glycine/D-amino acid oxidase-like deaminating enzyme/nitrite reductase/ring-hydroxylating ferredoxin subunit